MVGGLNPPKLSTNFPSGILCRGPCLCFPSGILCRGPCLWCGVYSDYSYLCSNDLQTLPAYRSCNVDHGCLCSHLNPPSRFPNTSRARLDTYIRNFLLFALQIYLMIDTIYRNLHYFHQAFSMLFYIQIPEGNHAGRFNIYSALEISPQGFYAGVPVCVCVWCVQRL